MHGGRNLEGGGRTPPLSQGSAYGLTEVDGEQAPVVPQSREVGIAWHFRRCLMGREEGFNTGKRILFRLAPGNLVACNPPTGGGSLVTEVVCGAFTDDPPGVGGGIAGSFFAPSGKQRPLARKREGIFFDRLPG